MSNLNSLINLANEAADASGVDMSETSTGGGGRRILPEGYALGRFVRYMELGKHAQEYNGEKKAPALQVRLGFALWGDGYQSEDGKPTFLNTFDISISNNEKAKAKIAFDRMNYKGTAKGFAQLLGQAYVVPVVIKKSKAGKERNEVDFKNILPPFDPVSKQPYPVPEADDELYQLFLWSKPTQETWDSIFIEGQFEDGRSKNFLQEQCLKATDFEGSALQHMLAGSGQAPEPPAPTAEAPKQEAPATPEVPAMPEMPKMPDFGGGE